MSLKKHTLRVRVDQTIMTTQGHITTAMVLIEGQRLLSKIQFSSTHASARA